MKNKYQEAFERIKRVVVFNKNYRDYENDLKVIKELVDKETPMKKIFSEELGVTTCGSCKKYLVSSNNWIPKYCSECGQKIDWSDEE